MTPNKAGSTVRMDWKPKSPDRYALYFHCQTNLVATFRTLFPCEFVFEGNRALLLHVGQRIPTDSIAFCIAAALTYHLKPPRATARRARQSA